MIELSVVCPIYNEEKYINGCIQSVLEQDYPRNEVEVLFVDGMSTDRTREIVSKYSEAYPFIRLLDNPQKIVPCAMNIGIAAAQGNVIMRLDAHASYEKNYFSALVQALYDLKADNVGTVCRTEVLNKTPKTLAIREVLSNKFGVGNSTFRTGITAVHEVDTVPFGCWRRSVFEEFGTFDERFIRNQDYEFNNRIRRNGGKIYIIPDTVCTYYARETFSKLWRQNYLNGKWGIKTIVYTRRTDSLALRHYVPMLFVLSLVVPALCTLFLPLVGVIAVLSLLVYCFTMSCAAAKTAISKRLNFFYLMAGFATLHLSNGCGMFVSMLVSFRQFFEIKLKLK